jgi:hypothetical protein
MLLHNDFPAGLAWASTPRAALDAEQAAAFAAAFYGSMWVGVRNAVVREVGFDAAYRLDERELRGHQQAYFLDGVRKLGLEAEPSDAIRCAKYHAMSNALGGGIRVRYAIESLSKAWIFYLPNFADPAVALRRDGVVTANYKGWHSNNGELLGNRRLTFVATHLLSRGDPYDAGYFVETTHEVPEEHRYSANFGERPPPSGRGSRRSCTRGSRSSSGSSRPTRPVHPLSAPRRSSRQPTTWQARPGKPGRRPPAEAPR